MREEKGASLEYNHKENSVKPGGGRGTVRSFGLSGPKKKRKRHF